MKTQLKYPLIVSDFDGTLVNKDGTISLENSKTIREYIASGGKFAISTGRLPAGILPRAKELGLSGMVCACQGAIIMDIESKELVSSAKLSFETTLKIVKKMEEMGLHIHIYDLWDFYSNTDDGALKIYENAVRGKAKLVLDKPLSKFVEETKFESYKVLAMVSKEENARVYEELRKANFEGCEITRSSNYLVEVINAGYSKGTAVEFLANYYGVPLEQTIAIGDQQNDLPMIKKAGLGIAVQNADAALKEAADCVCAFTNEESAVARIIKKYTY
ncbi:MAG: HAD family phosphatase [Clostridia bacterium]|nr:HAD family phosphatase [Clostridia bacterium]